MAKFDAIYDGADPGGTPGRVFTASIGDETIVPVGKFLDHLLIGLKGAVATAAVAIEDFVGVLSEYNFKAGSETRIQLSFRQMIALMNFYYGDLPFIWENTDATGNDFVGHVKLPIQELVDPSRPLHHSATRTAATNIGTETLAITGVYYNDAKGKRAVHAVRIPFTTAGAAGYDQMGVTVPPIGELIGVIIQQAAVFADGNIDVSVQRVQMNVNGQPHSKLNALAGSGGWAGKSVGVLDPMDDLMNPFVFWDMREDPIDLTANKVEFALDVEDVSDAITLIPVVLKK